MRRKKLFLGIGVLVLSVVLGLNLALAAIGSVNPGQPAQIGNLTVSGKIVSTPTNVVYCCTNTPTFSGVTNPNATVAFKITSTPVTFSTRSDANGNFSVASPRLEDGRHEVYVTVSDQSGSSAETLVATIDTRCGESALATAGTVIAKIALIALAIFMVLIAGYFALKKREVSAK